MSRSSGAGSPVWFNCAKARGYGTSRNNHTWVRTGRTRPYRPSYGTALGTRSMLFAHEYRCSCGHVGWTNHVDILHSPIEGAE